LGEGIAPEKGKSYQKKGKGIWGVPRGEGAKKGGFRPAETITTIVGGKSTTGWECRKGVFFKNTSAKNRGKTHPQAVLEGGWEMQSEGAAEKGFPKKKRSERQHRKGVGGGKGHKQPKTSPVGGGEASIPRADKAQ